MKGGFTPSEHRPLVKDVDEEPPSGIFIYSSVVGVLI